VPQPNSECISVPYHKKVWKALPRSMAICSTQRLPVHNAQHLKLRHHL